MLKFFKYENGEFSLNKEELLLIPSARALIHADKGGLIQGDYDGRRKYWAMKQFGVAWWITDVNSPGIQSGLEGRELMTDARKSLEIPKEWDDTKDDIFNTFLEVYQGMYNKASYSVLLKQLLMSFNDSATIIKAVRDMTTRILKKDSDLDANDIQTLMSSQRELIGVTSDIPKQLAKLKELQIMVQKEEKEQKIGRGNVVITSSMDPNNR